MRERNTLVVGQLRRWKFQPHEPQEPARRSAREGKCFLVIELDGIRCDTLQEGNSKESFYGNWLLSNSEPVKD
jgi:hypothetical protein